MSTPNELRVFISSTFRDLQEEREHLIKKIFPEIRALCRERGISFTEVDLRWGLTDEDVALGQVIRTCLDQVDQCRPYFIGITGDRYGFIPSHLDIYKDPALLQHYPWIEDAVGEQMSISEMEAQYAVLGRADGGMSRPELQKARFYFRRQRESFQDEPGQDEELRRLEAYQERIRASGVSIERFRDPVSLGELIFDDLARIIKEDFADAKPPTTLELERARHEAFSLSRRRAYIPNPSYLTRLNDHVKSDDPPLIIYAESGSGKSSLFAFWADQYRRKNPGAHVIEHYVGIGATATDHYAVIRHICMEIKDRFGRDEEVPSEQAQLDLALGQWFGYADHELRKASASGGRGESNGGQIDAPSSDSSLIGHPSSLIIILDGLNQLQGTALGLKWIPDVIAPSIRLIVSSTVEGTLVELQKRGWGRFGMQALTEPERETIIVRYLAEYGKSLLAEQIQRLARDYKCGHPLFLKTILEEIRLVSRSEELDAKINSYLDSTGTEDLFQRVLERLEDDYSLRSVRDVMTLLSASRSGLDERELSDLSGLARLKIATMIAGLDYHLVRKDGHLTFFHDYLRRAVEKRYLGDDAKLKAVHLRIAEYFRGGVTAALAAGRSVPVRTARELCYQLHDGGAFDGLKECLSTIPVFLVLYDGPTMYEVLGYWSSLREGSDIVEMYRRGIRDWSMVDAEEWCRGVGKVAEFLRRLGEWDGAIELGRARRDGAVEHGLESQEAASCVSLGVLLRLRGDYAASTEELSRGLALYTKLDDRKGIGYAVGSIGSLHYDRGEYDLAPEKFEQALQISQELGDRAAEASAIGNLGALYHARGEYDRSMKNFEQQLRICEELGDRSGIAVAIGNMGNALSSLGEHDRALECLGRRMTICEELGDRAGIARAVSNIGDVYRRRGEFDRAIDSIDRLMQMSEELGDRMGIAKAHSAMGHIHSERGEHDRALESYQRALQIGHELGDAATVSRAVGNMGSVYSTRGEYVRALEHFEEQLRICEELGYRAGVSTAVTNMASAYLGLDDFDQTLVYLERQVRMAEEIGDRSDIAYAMGTMGNLHFGRGDYDRALECWDQWLKAATELGDRASAAIAIGNSGTAYTACGEYDRALASFARGLAEQREVGHRRVIAATLENRVRLYLELFQQRSMPRSLPEHLPTATTENWRAVVLQQARCDAEECLSISQEIHRADLTFLSRVQLARITAAEGDVEQARTQLGVLLDVASDDIQRAELHYQLWKMESPSASHHPEALRLYRSLIARTPKHEYRMRIDELTASSAREADDATP